MIQLVICDLDGTLIGKDEILPKPIISLATKLRNSGILFTIATGRVETMAHTYVNDLGIDIPYILTNGATIVDKGETLQRYQIPLAPLKPIVEMAKGIGLSLVYTIEGTEFVVESTPWIEGQQNKFNRYHSIRDFKESDWDTLLLDKLMIMDDVRDGRISQVEDACSGLSEYFAVTRYSDKAIELVQAKVSKGESLKTILSILGIKPESVLAIGDHQNDIEMLQVAGVGVAVANAIEPVKQIADYVCTLPAYEGVLEAVDKYCFSQGSNR